MDHPLIMAEFKTNLEATQGDTPYELVYMIKLGTFRTQELATRRDIEEQVPDIERCTHRVCARLGFSMTLVPFTTNRPA